MMVCSPLNGFCNFDLLLASFRMLFETGTLEKSRHLSCTSWSSCRMSKGRVCRTCTSNCIMTTSLTRLWNSWQHMVTPLVFFVFLTTALTGKKFVHPIVVDCSNGIGHKAFEEAAKRVQDVLDIVLVNKIGDGKVNDGCGSERTQVTLFFLKLSPCVPKHCSMSTPICMCQKGDHFDGFQLCVTFEHQSSPCGFFELLLCCVCRNNVFCRNMWQEMTRSPR